jgi:hypothetical protein
MQDTGSTSVYVIILAAVLVTLVLMALVSLVRAMLAGRHKEIEPRVVPIEDPFAAAQVAMNRKVAVDAWAVLVWSGLNIVIAISYALWGAGVHGRFSVLFGLGYAVFASLLAVAGSLMLMRAIAFGRTMIAWGMFLFGTVGFILMVGALMLPGNTSADPDLRAIGYYLAAGLAAHIVIDVFLGAVSQFVGKPPKVSST